MSESVASHAAESPLPGRSLSAQLLSGETFDRLLEDARRLVEVEFARKGMGIRTALKVAQKAKPGLIDKALRHLLPKFVEELEPYHDAWLSRDDGASFEAYLVEHDDSVATALLTVADHAVGRVQSRPVKAGYAKLRDRAGREVKNVVPEMAAIVDRHLDRPVV